MVQDTQGASDAVCLQAFLTDEAFWTRNICRSHWAFLFIFTNCIDECTWSFKHRALHCCACSISWTSAFWKRYLSLNQSLLFRPPQKRTTSQATPPQKFRFAFQPAIWRRVVCVRLINEQKYRNAS